MKNKIDHLLYCLGEEAGEIQQAAGKAGRFGFLDLSPNNHKINIQQIYDEVHDLIAIYEMLMEETGFSAEIPLKREKINAKKERTIEYMDYARKRGQLETAPHAAANTAASPGTVAAQEVDRGS